MRHSSRPVKSPIARPQQSNAPALDTLLRHPEDIMYSRTGFSQSKAEEFATPKANKMKSRPRVIVERIEETRDQKSPKQKFKSKADDFATPRVSKSKPKIIHKEKLNPPISVKHVTKGLLGKSTSSGSLPTAHVYPSPISNTSTLTPTSNYGGATGLSEISSYPCWDDSTLATTMAESPYSNGISRMTDTTINTYRNTERFNDRGGRFKDEELSALAPDPDSTILDTGGSSIYRNVGIRDKFSLHERDITLRGKLSLDNDDRLSDMTRSVSALSLDTPTVTNLSDPGTSMYGSTGAIYNPHTANNTSQHHHHHQQQQHSLYNNNNRSASHLPSYNSYDRLPSSFQAGPSSFQAASFNANSMGRSAGYHHGGSGLYPGTMGHEAQFSNDLTNWQQRHQEQLHRQQVEAQQSVMNGQPGSSYNPAMMSGDPHRMDAIKQAADNIIKEKDNIIDRQKIKILELERHTKESEVDLHKSMLKKIQEEGNSLNFKLQESQYESATLKAQLAELMSNRTGDLEILEKKLAATEYELSELKASLDKEITSKRRDIQEMQAKVGDKESLVQDYKDKLNSTKIVNEDLQTKVSSLERYLADLPTVDEHSKKHSEIQLLKEDKVKYKHRSLELEKKLKELRKGVSSRDGLIESLELREKELQEKIEQVQGERDGFSHQVHLLRTDGATIPEEDLAELHEENERLRADCDKAKKLLDNKHRKLQQVESQHKQEVTQLEERLYQDENSVTALRDDMANKEQHLKKLRASVKELGSQNQDLMEENMMLQDQVKHFEKQHTGEAEKLEKRLMKEMAVCFSELQSLVQVCVQHAEGQDPNISVLLGVKTNAMCDLDMTEPLGDGIQSLKYKVSKVKELREEIDKLRELLSNKFAEDMGENLNCTTQ